MPILDGYKVMYKKVNWVADFVWPIILYRIGAACSSYWFDMILLEMEIFCSFFSSNLGLGHLSQGCLNSFRYIYRCSTKKNKIQEIVLNLIIQEQKVNLMNLY